MKPNNTKKKKTESSAGTFKSNNKLVKKKIRVETKLQFYLSTCDSSGYKIYLKDETALIPTKENYYISSFSICNKHGLLRDIDEEFLKDELYLSGYIIPNKDSEIEITNKRINHIGPIIKRYYKNNETNNYKWMLETSEALYTLVKPDPEYTLISFFGLKILHVTCLVILYLTKNTQKNPSMKSLHNFLSCQLKQLKSVHYENYLEKNSHYLYSNILAVKNLPNNFFKLSCISQLNEYFRNSSQISYTFRDISNYSTSTKATITSTIKHILNQTEKCLTHYEGEEDETEFTELNSDLENYDEYFINQNINHNENNVMLPTTNQCSVQLQNNFIEHDSKYFYYSVIHNNQKIRLGDFVTIQIGQRYCIIEITLIFKEDEDDMGYFHGRKYVLGCDTILGSVDINPHEIYMTNDCFVKCPLSAIITKANVTITFDAQKDSNNKSKYSATDNKFFCQKLYTPLSGRFEDLPLEKRNAAENNYSKKNKLISITINTLCSVCEYKFKAIFQYIPTLKGRNESFRSISDVYKWDKLEWKNDVYTAGVAVFLKPYSVPLVDFNLINSEKKDRNYRVDHELYPELHRKNNHTKMNNIPPYQIAIITEILSKNVNNLYVGPKNIFFKVQIMYRPENVTKQNLGCDDLNMVYWSEDIFEISFDKLIGRCSLYYKELSLRELYKWSEEDHNRFYFNTELKNGELKKILEPSKLMKQFTVEIDTNKSISTKRPLRMMDVFAGCGGFSTGICESGVAECKWAIEHNTSACVSFKTNHKNVIIFNDDCNKLLIEILNGSEYSTEGHKLPKPGEVDLLCGGPPCQGFSGMNRFSDSEYSQLKNSLVATFLSYCDYYRPTYFIMENVKNFALYKKQKILKWTLTCLLEMGYQCAVSILQAGQFGVPQSRKRVIIFASAPGYKLPEIPEPSYVFNRHTIIRGLNFKDEVQVWSKNFSMSAPRRMLTVKDAISDLPPPITRDISKARDASETLVRVTYSNTTHYQRLLRKGKFLFTNYHTTKRISPIADLRISLIPKFPNADWQNLPNISMVLEDQTHAKKLEYYTGMYKDKEKRGVCICITGENCSSAYRQENTIIPWCLAHTADRNNNWVGLYGRLSNEGYFETVVTNPDPLRKQGKVIHPDQDRILSVREYARAQGFPDDYELCGTVDDRYTQLGNAVPPPLGYAIGKELRIAYFSQ